MIEEQSSLATTDTEKEAIVAILGRINVLFSFYTEGFPGVNS